MTIHPIATLALCTSMTLPLPALAAARVGEPAPAFSATDTDGKTHYLADYKGKYVVLEWVNPSCPFVVKHYSSGNMQSTQQQAIGAGAVWLAVNSTAQSHSEYLQPAALGDWMKSQKAAPSATLMDAAGSLGKAYGARTTPHMYLIDPQGTLIYAGAIDSKPSARIDDIAGASNYVKVGLGEAMAGKPLTSASTRAYGCSVKYE